MGESDHTATGRAFGPALRLFRARCPRSSRALAHDQAGFTLVELLVVMLILGVLAAISVPNFLSQKDKARDEEAKVAAKTARLAMETYATDHDGAYTGVDAAALVAIESALVGPASLALLSASSPSPDAYEIAVASKTGENVFYVTRQPGVPADFPCDNAGNDGCPSSGDWG